MILKIGKRSEHRVSTLKEASDLYAQVRDESGEGASTFPEGQLLGTSTYRVSYNAKIWSEDSQGPYVVYNPYLAG